jgi:hypothetical protein
MSRISERLRCRVKDPCINARPFVCDGNPEDCRVMIIGENPALELNVNWWDFWCDDTGFDLHKFNEQFQQQQKSKTHKALEKLWEPLRNAKEKCLVTNRFRNENRGGAKKSKAPAKNDDVLELLLSELKQLEAVVAYGVHAIDFIEQQPLSDHVHVELLPHLTRVPYDKLDEVADQLLVLSDRAQPLRFLKQIFSWSR